MIALGPKIVPFDELVQLVEGLRAQGRRVVMCHGVFDLLHVGHIRHFREARSFGDVLIVTLTEDKHVNKGPGRPAFPEALRAEAIAALGDVDYVAINRYPTAVEALEAIKPDVYAKGPDYRDAAQDVTGMIVREREAVEAGGGRIAFTDDVTFSSSNLLNRYFPAYGADVDEWLREFRDRFSYDDVARALDGFRAVKPVVVGEAILDEYVYVDQMGKSAKEPVLAMRYGSKELFAGGSLAIANHLAEFCDEVELVTFLGDRETHEDFARAHLRPNVRPTFLYKHDSPTILKRRYVESYLLSKLFEVYHINDEPLDDEQDAEFCRLLAERIRSADVTLVSDFGHGMITPRGVRELGKHARFLAVNTQINAANVGFHTISKYRRADYVCVHEGEIRLDARSRRAQIADLVSSLHERLDCDNVLVTRGRKGVSYFRPDGPPATCPAFTSTAVDRIGAGDAVLSLSSLAVASHLPGEMVAFIANVVGAQAVQIVGNREPVSRVGTLKFVKALLQ
ncbi:MAG: adenylyltransferase/cytidyltransferase family protein [Actinobacteria bacterium]|nr:adenylyltransferase/cytidyltransferase family protein [Actinomycetota bacterium]